MAGGNAGGVTKSLFCDCHMLYEHTACFRCVYIARLALHPRNRVGKDRQIKIANFESKAEDYCKLKCQLQFTATWQKLTYMYNTYMYTLAHTNTMINPRPRPGYST